MKDNKNIWLWGVLTLLLFITFFPLNSIGIVTGDDLGYMLWPKQNILKDSILFAQGTGRFYFLLTLWIYKIPYLIDSTFYFHFMLIFPHCLAFLLFVLLVKRGFNNLYIGLLSGVLFCALFQITGDHSATAAYPFYFSFSFSILLGSLHLLLSYLKTKKYKYILYSSLLMGSATLFYESYLVFYLLIGVLLLSKYKLKELFSSQKGFTFIKEILPFFIFGLLYMITYFVYSKIYSGGYQGNSFSAELKPEIFYKTLYNLTIYSYPLSSIVNYKFFLLEYSLQDLQTINIFTLVFKQASVTAYIKGILVLGIFIGISLKTELKMKNIKLIGIGIIAFLFSILPHLPLALSEKYTSTIPNIYVTTYFSNFSVFVLCLVIILFLLKFFKSNKWIQYSIIGMISLVLFTATVITQNINEKVCEDLKVAEKRITVMKYLFQEHLIEKDAAVFVAPLHESKAYFSKPITRQGNTFTGFADHYGLKIDPYLDYTEFYNQYNDSTSKVYLISFTQAFKTGDAAFSLLCVRGDQLKQQIQENRGDSLLVGYLSPYKKMGIAIATDSISELTIQEEKMVHTGNFHYNNIHFLKKPEICSFWIKGWGIIPGTLSISNNLFPQIPLQRIGWYPVLYEKEWIQQISNKLENSIESKKSIQLKALQSGISYEKALENDAKWILFNEYQ